MPKWRQLARCGRRFLPREEAFQIPDLIRTKINLLPEGITEVRTVEIVGLDLQADGGTHVDNTADVGTIRVTDYKSKGKINKRIYIELGLSRAATVGTSRKGHDDRVWTVTQRPLPGSQRTWCFEAGEQPCMTPDMHDILACGLSAGRGASDHGDAGPRSAPARRDGGARLPGADHRCGAGTMRDGCWDMFSCPTTCI